MLLNHWKPGAVLALFLISMHAFAADPPAVAVNTRDQQAYCSYVMEQAQAQRDLLRTPVAAAGMTQPETGLPLQLVAGASVGLSAMRKASLTMDAARRNCELYKAMTGAQQSIQYALSSLEKEALRNRLVLIDQASTSLDGLMDKTSKMVEARNATRLMLFLLQTTRIKLDADRADTQSKIAALYTPPLSDKPLKELVAEKQMSEGNEQRRWTGLAVKIIGMWLSRLASISRSIRLPMVLSRMARSLSTTISPAGPSTSIWIAP